MARVVHIVILLALIIAVEATGTPNPNGVVLKITKDGTTKQYYTTLGIGTQPRLSRNLVLDLGGTITWLACDFGSYSQSFRTVPCDSPICNSTMNLGCVIGGSIDKPSSVDNTCVLTNTYNPIMATYSSGNLYRDSMSFSSPIIDTPPFLFSCADISIYNKMAGGAVGMLGLSNHTLSIPYQLSSAYKLFPKKFALCLPSRTRPGSSGFGNLFLGGMSHDSKLFSAAMTPLVTNPVSALPTPFFKEQSYAFFIDIKSIQIDGKPLSFDKSLLTIDETGYGGTTLQTVAPYSVLRGPIYRALVEEFTIKAERMNISRVAPVAPFGACFSPRSIRKTNMGGLNVPVIDLVVGGGEKWRIYGANSMVKVKNVRCLGFVDGGEELRSGIVIGGFQMEDNLLEFDLQSSKLGFTSLHLKNSSCSSLQPHP